MDGLPPSEKTRWRRERVVIPVVICVGLIAFAGVVLSVDALLGPDYVVGPTPEEIEEECEPIVRWILAQRDEHGAWPRRLLPEHEATLDAFPYYWDYGRGKYALLQVGDMGDWPYPIYGFYWRSLDGWSFACDTSCTFEQAREVLEEHGYYE